MEELRKGWEKGMDAGKPDGFLNKNSLHRIIKERSNQQRNISMKYFWGSFTLQILVYAFLSHVIIRFWSDPAVTLPAGLLFMMYIPFTFLLMKKFKALAVLRTDDRHSAGLPIREYVQQQHHLLSSFYHFKRKYEAVLGVVSILIMIWIPFHLWVPGGVREYPITALMIFLSTWIPCALIVRNENTKYFKRPIRRLELVLYDLDH